MSGKDPKSATRLPLAHEQQPREALQPVRRDHPEQRERGEVHGPERELRLPQPPRRWRPHQVAEDRGYRDEGHGEEPQAQVITVSTGYFETVRAALLAGRYFTDHDHAQAEPVVVVNQTFARRAFPGEEAMGKRITPMARQIGPLGRNLSGVVPFRIVGVGAGQHKAGMGDPASVTLVGLVRGRRECRGVDRRWTAPSRRCLRAGRARSPSGAPPKKGAAGGRSRSAAGCR